MRKQTLIITVLLCAVVLGGCRKKEAVNLSSIHTTAAVDKESLTPAQSTASKESEAANASEEESKGGSSEYSFKTDIKTYSDKGASVEYPLISNMKDSEKEKKLNDLLKHNAIGVIDAYPLSNGQSLTIHANVISSNLKRITIVYTGELTGGSGTTPIFYSNTVDVDTLDNLSLKDFADPYTIAGYIASGDYTLESKGGDEAAVRSYINSSSRNLDYYYKGLSGADFTGGYKADGTLEPFTEKTWPKFFSYEKYGVVYVSLPVSKELGGYALIKYTPDNK